MKHLKSKITIKNSNIEYSYITIKVTKSRLDKGLLAIPISLIENFPKKKQIIKVFFGNNYDEYVNLNFTPYTSSSRECRIGGMKNWFDLNKIKNGEELVIQILNKENNEYRILTEKQYLQNIKLLQEKLDDSNDEVSIKTTINKLSLATNTTQIEIYNNEFLRLSKQNNLIRNTIRVSSKNHRESVPYSIRKILEEVYKGRCQLTNFTFIQKNGKPYFEIHHIKENRGNYLKNLLVVSPNIHAQFTYSNKKEYFNKNGWLRKVKFNETTFNVYQYIDTIKEYKFIKKVHE